MHRWSHLLSPAAYTSHSFSRLCRKSSSPWTCWAPTLSSQTSPSLWPSSSPAPRAPAKQAAAARARGRLPKGGSTVPLYASICRWRSSYAVEARFLSVICPPLPTSWSIVQFSLWINVFEHISIANMLLETEKEIFICHTALIRIS